MKCFGINPGGLTRVYTTLNDGYKFYLPLQFKVEREAPLCLPGTDLLGTRSSLP